jgi:hypothetical protein
MCLISCYYYYIQVLSRAIVIKQLVSQSGQPQLKGRKPVQLDRNEQNYTGLIALKCEVATKRQDIDVDDMDL